jgi:AcrR family transcriptional regulator
MNHGSLNARMNRGSQPVGVTMNAITGRTDRVTKRIADKRTRILQAARDLVAEGGWSAAQVDNVAARAGIATGTVYRHWSSKAELCAEIVANVSTREVAIIKALADADGSPAEKLVAAVRTFASRALQGRRLAYALIAEPVDPDVESVRLDYRAQLAHCFEQILREGIMRGVFPRLDPAVAAACIVGAFMEALVGPLAPTKGTGTRANRQLVEQITQFCLRASIGNPESAS